MFNLFVHKLWHLHGEKRQIWIISYMREVFHTINSMAFLEEQIMFCEQVKALEHSSVKKNTKAKRVIVSAKQCHLPSQSVCHFSFCPWNADNFLSLSHLTPPPPHPPTHMCTHACTHTHRQQLKHNLKQEREKREATHMRESECDRESERGERWKLLTLVGPHSGYEAIQTKILEQKSNQINLYYS